MDNIVMTKLHKRKIAAIKERGARRFLVLPYRVSFLQNSLFTRAETKSCKMRRNSHFRVNIKL